MSSSMPPEGAQPEYLEQGAGSPVASDRPSAGGGRRKAVVAGGVVAGLALLGGGVWAATWYLGTGPQPAESLPAATLGYVSIDLDPSGDQKIEAIRTLNKFPALEGELNLGTDDDVKKRIFEEMDLGGACDGLDYADDIEPWLGDRAAVAAVDLGEEVPAPVGVIQVKDADAAEDGLATLRDCSGSEETVGWAIEGEWAVVAETDAIALDVADQAAEAPLSDDEDHQGWLDEVGDTGVATLYVAPSAGDLLADQVENFLGLGSMASGSVTMESEPASATSTTTTTTTSEDIPAPATEELRRRLQDFEGMAITLRFDDGAVELEMAGDAEMGTDFLPVTDGADDVLATLPNDTAVAVGLGLADGWFGEMLDQLASMSGMEVDQLVAEGEAELGLELPEDVETLFGDSAAIAMGSGFDPEAFFNSSDGTDAPFGFKVKGDAAAIEEVVAKLQEQITADGGPELVTKVEGDTVAFGLNEDYVASIAADGDLGDSEVYQNVVRESEDASMIAFVDFDGGTDWLAELAADDEDVAENVRPLEGFGMSSWLDDEVAHAVLRLTTD